MPTLRALERPLLALALACLVGGGEGRAADPNGGAFGNLPPASVSRFVPETSSSWRGNDALRFSSTYAQGTTVRGFLCSDFVQVGPYGSFSPFCCVTSVSGMFDGSGIAGFAPPSRRDPKSEFPPLPPLFLSLANITGQDTAKHDSPVPKPIFSFLSSPDDAELQLGGYDEGSVVGKMHTVKSLSKYAYVVPITSIKLGNVDIVKLSGKGGGQVSAILDSGTTCICLPHNDMGGEVVGSPWDNFDGAWQQQAGQPLEVVVDGSIRIEIPSSVWLPQMQSVSGCLMKGCPNDHVVLGDWLFQSWLAMFDLGPTAHHDAPTIGLAKRDLTYRVGGKYQLHESRKGVTKVAMRREKVKKEYSTPKMPGYGGSSNSVPDVSLSIVHDLYYLLPVMVGNPPQRFDVVFDTGSSFFGLVTAPADSQAVQAALIKLGRGGGGGGGGAPEPPAPAGGG